MNDPYDNLGNLLTEMQHELWAHEWSRDVHEHIKRASDFRGDLFKAISAYVEYHVERAKP